MRNSCLKTQLKASVANQNLNYLGMLPLYVKESGICTTFNLYEPLTRYLIHPDGTKEQVTGNIASKFVANGTLQKFFLSDTLYDGLLPFTVNTSIGALNNTLVYIDTKDLISAPVRNIGYRNSYGLVAACPIEGNIANIFKNSEPNLEFNVFAIRANENNITGTSTDFKTFFRKMPNVEHILWGNGVWSLFSFEDIAEVTNCQLTELQGRGVKGDIYPFIQKARLNNRVTGTLVITFANYGSYTLDGDSITHNTAYEKITWTSNAIEIYEASLPNDNEWTLKQSFNK